MQRRKETGKDKKQPSQEKTTEDKEDPKEDLDEFFRNFYPGVACFIAYTHTRECNPDTIFALRHYLDNDVEVKTIDSRNNKKRSHTQLDSRKQVIAFQDRVITINIKEAQHPLK